MRIDNGSFPYALNKFAPDVEYLYEMKHEFLCSHYVMEKQVLLPWWRAEVNKFFGQR